EYPHEELDGCLTGFVGVLGYRLRIDVWFERGMGGYEWLLPFRLPRSNRYLFVSPVSDSVLRHRRNHRLRSDGRAHALYHLLDLQRLHDRAHLPRIRSLGVGRSV